MDNSEAPVKLFTYRMLVQLSPPSNDLKIPRSLLGPYKAPCAATKRIFGHGRKCKNICTKLWGDHENFEA